MAPVSICTTNIAEGETVHQRCLLLTGTCTANTDEDGTLRIKSTSEDHEETFPEQCWPIAGGNFKALVMFSPDQNTLELTHSSDSDRKHSQIIHVVYSSLLQNPPIYLAIMVAKDSPLRIDCPLYKGAGHLDLDAAIARFRMTAYMWQAMTAEDLRLKGFGRRTFRLEDEDAPDTVSKAFVDGDDNDPAANEDAIRSTAKVHIVRSSKTLRQIRNPNIAQQNPKAKKGEDLYGYFMDALKESGEPFSPSDLPVVAGLILDAHYSSSKKLIVGHAALGLQDPEGISLGIFGSHLTYSWPRFLEEVNSCLTELQQPGGKCGNDSGECDTDWEACTVGQGAFLHEVGHALGSPHTDGIMTRGYVPDWPKNFVPKTSYCRLHQIEDMIVDDSTPNDARWPLGNALSFRLLPQFRWPFDEPTTQQDRDAQPLMEV